MMNGTKEYVFGLDIGTRSIVGTVGYRENAYSFRVVSQVSIEHKTRAVIDGQIHDIPTVAKTIKAIKEQLEEMIESTLTHVCIAAAGRVLRTKKVKITHEFPEETTVLEEHIHSLDMSGVEKAYEMVREDIKNENNHFYCVGYSTVQYYLNDYAMAKIELHKANTIGVELIATFLPDEVVEGLYTAVELAGLTVSNLTLEPIAAISIAIPEKFRLLNIALVDIGAGTSDISIVKDGSIIAFGMLPLAGDEITETIAREYLVDFQTAEDVKIIISKQEQVSFDNIMGDTLNVTSDEVLDICKDVVVDITKKLADKIIELNSGKKVSAVFIVGGGGKLAGFVESITEHMELPLNRVAIRGEEVLKNVTFVQTDIKKDSTLVTPIGICLTHYDNTNSFIHVIVNDEKIKIYDNNNLTVLDAVLQAGFLQEDLLSGKGENIVYRLNGEKQEIRGAFGEPAVIKKNEKNVSLNEKIKDNDEIKIVKAIAGKSGKMIISDLREYKNELHFNIYGKTMIMPPRIMANRKQVTASYEIQKNDEIEILDCYPLSQVFQFFGLDESKTTFVNGTKRELSEYVYNGDVIAEENKKEKLIENNQQEIEPYQGSALKQVVNINGTPITLEDKANHIFVDVFDVYPFDLSKATGRKLITKVNGIIAEFTQPISHGDDIELKWGE